MVKGLTFSIGIPTFNRNQDLRKCLEALRKQTFGDFDIVVVNGGDLQGVKQTVNDFTDLRIKVVNQEKKGVVEARNLGWRHSTADVACIIDDDLIVSSDWLAQIKETFLSDEKIGGVTGPTIIPEERQQSRDLAMFLDEFNNSGNFFLRMAGKLYLNFVLENKVREVGKILKSGAFTPGSNYKDCLNLPLPVEVDYLEACHMCFKKSIFEKLGGFSEDYTGTGEWNEPDFSFKARALGFKLVFNPKAITEHHISQSGVYSARTNAYERSRNFIHFYFSCVKPDSPAKLVHFSVNLCFINGYWFYKFLKSGNLGWLSGITGTFTGLWKEIISWR